ncbi:hypothetical protein P7C71_g6484, partial [Lecanoromycetidae sp. Uapishka_2]
MEDTVPASSSTMIEISGVDIQQIPSGLKFCGDPVVTLFVGEERHVFYVHLKLLCAASPVFKAAFSGNFKESKDHAMDLPDDDRGTIDRMIQWLYSRDYDLPGAKPGPPCNECYKALVMLNILADKYGITELSKQSTKKLFKMFKNYKNPPTMALTKEIYNNTTQSSPLRKLITDWFSWGIDLSWLTRDGNKAWLVYNSELTADIVSALAQRVDSPESDPLQGNGLKYGLEDEAPESNSGRPTKKRKLARHTE